MIKKLLIFIFSLVIVSPFSFAVPISCSGGAPCPTGYECKAIDYSNYWVCANKVRGAANTESTYEKCGFKDFPSVSDLMTANESCGEGTNAFDDSVEPAFEELCTQQDLYTKSCPIGSRMFVLNSVGDTIWCVADDACCINNSTDACSASQPCCFEGIDSLSCQKQRTNDTQLRCLTCTRTEDGVCNDGTHDCCYTTSNENLQCVTLSGAPVSVCKLTPEGDCLGGKLSVGQDCWVDSQCATNSCDESGTNKCVEAADGACREDCQCASGHVCNDASPSDPGTCGVPGDTRCLDPNQVCDPDGDCCEDVDGKNYECVSGVGDYERCLEQGECKTGECSPGDTCCSVGDTPYSCTEDGPGAGTFHCAEDTNPANCTPKDPCSDSYRDCCQFYNSDDVCDTLTHTCVAGGAECSEDENGGCCASGMRCSGGLCNVPDTTCNAATFNPADYAYAGPILSISELLAGIFKVLYPIGLVFGVYNIVTSGYKLMTSEGEPNMVRAAQESLTSAILGTLFILLSITILRVIINSLVGAVAF